MRQTIRPTHLFLRSAIQMIHPNVYHMLLKSAIEMIRSDHLLLKSETPKMRPNAYHLLLKRVLRPMGIRMISSNANRIRILHEIWPKLDIRLEIRNYGAHSFSERLASPCRALKRYIQNRRRLLDCDISHIIESPYAAGFRNSPGGFRHWSGASLRRMLIGG